MALTEAIRMVAVRAQVPPTTVTPPRAVAVVAPHRRRHRVGAAAEVAAVIPVEATQAEVIPEADSPEAEEGVANSICTIYYS